MADVIQLTAANMARGSIYWTAAAAGRRRPESPLDDGGAILLPGSLWRTDGPSGCRYPYSTSTGKKSLGNFSFASPLARTASQPGTLRQAGVLPGSDALFVWPLVCVTFAFGLDASTLYYLYDRTDILGMSGTSGAIQRFMAEGLLPRRVTHSMAMAMIRAPCNHESSPGRPADQTALPDRRYASWAKGITAGPGA